MQCTALPALARLPVCAKRRPLRISAALLAGCAGLLALPVLECASGLAADAHARPRKSTAHKHAKHKESHERALERVRRRTMPAGPPVPVQKPKQAKQIEDGEKGKSGDAANDAKSTSTPVLDTVQDKQLTAEQKKAAVLAAPADVLRRVGRHVITGYHTPAQLTPLLERAALGGVFVTARNTHRRNKDVLASELASLRSLAATSGQAAFWVSTDQEGGSVSRLSPPLSYQVSLPRMLRGLKADASRTQAVEAYAAKQAAALASIGINLNFAPVADLNHNLRSSADRYTRIRNRAISDKPSVVAEVAHTYCEQFNKAQVYCTLKHFPGLGRVASDTHVTPATLKTPADELAHTDWLPFRNVLERTPAFVMVGHHQVASLDADGPASTSPAVVQKLLREEWKFDGVVVTDDLVMGAITRRKGGMAQAAVDALNAGVDLVLIGTENDAVYDVLYALVIADQEGRLDHAKLNASEKRLARAAAPIALSRQPESAAPPLPAKSPRTKTARQ